MTEDDMLPVKVNDDADIFDLACIAAGAYNGYCHAKGIELPQNTEFWTTWGPIMVQSAIASLTYGYANGVAIYRKEKRDAMRNHDIDDDNDIWTNRDIPKENESIAPKVALVTGIGLTIGCVGGGLSGGIEIAIGYGIGYVIGTVAGR
jgi:hypothetical protein